MFIIKNNKTALIILCIFIPSCKTSSSYLNQQGYYYKKGKGYRCSVTLNKDSTFLFTKKYFEADSKCNGKWYFLTKDTLLLKCKDAALYDELISGYIRERNFKAILINKNKLKVDNITLKKQPSKKGNKF